MTYFLAYGLTTLIASWLAPKVWFRKYPFQFGHRYFWKYILGCLILTFTTAALWVGDENGILAVQGEYRRPSGTTFTRNGTGHGRLIAGHLVIRNEGMYELGAPKP